LKNSNIPQSEPKNSVVQHFGGFFHEIKVCQPVGIKVSLSYKPCEE
jgi:hypothetical protein